MPCSNFYCISGTGIPNVDDSYSLAGVYNTRNYWLGSTYGYYIYWVTGTSEYWCVSSSLGGSCILFGASPCSSSCPDICDSNFSIGACPTPTPTPTVNCTVLDFTAIFDCEVTPSSTVTPTVTPTPTMTPTPSSSDYCPNIGIDVMITGITPTSTSTPTPTPTSSPVITYYCNFSGDVSFVTVNSIIQCPGSKEFQDCYTGEFYYTTSEVVTPLGGPLTQFMIFESNVDGISSCISYVGNSTKTIGVNTITLIAGPLGYSNLGECYLCVPQVSQTPTNTPTNTPTPTLTPTPTPSLEPFYYLFRRCDKTNEYVIQTSPSLLSLIGQTLFDLNVNSCWEYISQTVSYPSLSPFNTVTYFAGNYFTNTTGIAYNNCPDCISGIPPSSTPTPTPTSTPTNVSLCSVIYVDEFNKIYSYNINTNVSILLPIQSNIYNTDIGHTENKLWTSDNFSIREWNITLSPFTSTYNRNLTLPFAVGNGLGVVNDTTLIVSNVFTPQSIYEIDITTNSPVSTYKFDLPPTQVVAGDMLLTTTNKLLVTTNESLDASIIYLLQYDYSTGSLELTIPLNPTVIGGPWGIFENSGNIYVGTGIGNIYSVNTSIPYNITYLSNTSHGILGSSQVPSCLNSEFTIPCLEDCTTFLLFRGTSDGSPGFSIYTYKQSSNTLTLFSNFSNIYIDIANTTDKLWLLKDDGLTIEEYDLTLCPATITFNQNLTSPVKLGSLFAENNLILYSTNVGVTPNTIINLALFLPPISFNIGTLPIGYSANKDIIVTNTDKIIILVSTSSPSPSQRVLQYDLLGTLEFDINITSGMPGKTVSSIFEESSEIYLITQDNSIYKISNVSPYSLLPQPSIIGSPGANIGASQAKIITEPVCLPTNFE